MSFWLSFSQQKYVGNHGAIYYVGREWILCWKVYCQRNNYCLQYIIKLLFSYQATAKDNVTNSDYLYFTVTIILPKSYETLFSWFFGGIFFSPKWLVKFSYQIWFIFLFLWLVLCKSSTIYYYYYYYLFFFINKKCLKKLAQIVKLILLYILFSIK